MTGVRPTTVRARLAVLAIGKAGGDMMQVALEQGVKPDIGLLVVPPGHLPPGVTFPGQIDVILGGHPVPNAASLAAAERALSIASTLGPEDQLLVLLSGGGSALMSAPARGVTLAEKQAVTRALLRSGAGISEINCVRRHLSRVKGGKLANAAGDAQVTTLIISDVPGDDPALVSSGPTIRDSTTPADARQILDRYRVEVSAAVETLLADQAELTSAWLSPAPSRRDVRVLARARDALDAAITLARARGLDILDLGDDLQGEARQLGADHARLATDIAATGRPTLILSGGETTVTISDPEGRGGRNLEYLLGLTLALDGAPGIHALACDTDGIDGTDRAAGAVTHPDTLARARQAGIDPAHMLDRNNAFLFFEAMGDLVETGPTRTNVNDFRAILVNPII